MMKHARQLWLVINWEEGTGSPFRLCERQRRFVRERLLGRRWGNTGDACDCDPLMKLFVHLRVKMERLTGLRGLLGCIESSWNKERRESGVRMHQSGLSSQGNRKEEINLVWSQQPLSFQFKATSSRLLFIFHWLKITLSFDFREKKRTFSPSKMSWESLKTIYLQLFHQTSLISFFNCFHIFI